MRTHAMMAIPTKQYPATKSPVDESICHSPSSNGRRERKSDFLGRTHEVYQAKPKSKKNCIGPK
jgi:hypothetical protein